MNANYVDPYQGNILVEGLGPILSPTEASKGLLYLPPLPGNLQQVPFHIRLHLLMNVRDLHIPSIEGGRLQTTVDLMLRQGYRYRDPATANTWRVISGDSTAVTNVAAPLQSLAPCAAVAGLSGSGKTVAVLRSMSLNPSQIIVHEKFPHMVSGLEQVVWLSTNVPSSGRAVDLAANLMMSWDHATRGSRFTLALNRPRRNSFGLQMLDEWRQVASSHFLGILHLDEIQNFFSIPSLKKRAAKSKGGLELSIVEDSCLKWILNLTNTGGIPLLLTGTPDGVGALSKRMSAAQRAFGWGYHKFMHFDDANHRGFKETFFPALFRYQYVSKKIEDSTAFRELLIRLTGGLPRNIIALWIAAHRVAFDRRADELRIEDFKKASETYLAPLGPAIAALLSRDPVRMAMYEDLMPRDEDFWETFWSSVAVM